MHNLAECATTTRTIWQNVLQLPAQSGRMCYNYPHNLEECATTTRTIWKNVLQLPAQSGRMCYNYPHNLEECLLLAKVLYLVYYNISEYARKDKLRQGYLVLGILVVF